jgi:tyrosyl-tRNA synthetase
MASLNLDEQVQTLMLGCQFNDGSLAQSMHDELRSSLEASAKTGKPLRVYAGYDPTRPDLHLGHSITLRKLREFQDLGHTAIFLVGTFTAQVGDTSDKATGRPRKTPEEVRAAAASYAEQCFTILDRDKTEVVYNADWLSQLSLSDIVQVASSFTVQQFLTRDAYRKRLDKGNPIGLHEFFYALLQGYDALHLECDVQLGATEQLFNIMAGRKLQQVNGKKGCVCLTFPILVGVDGTQRMSKSAGNVIGLSEPPDEQFGKAMSISDETMRSWIPLVTRWTPARVGDVLSGLDGGRLHPMAVKKELAAEIVAQFHGNDAARAAQESFEGLHQRHEMPDDMPTLAAPEPLSLLEVLSRVEGVTSKTQARKLVQQGGVKVDGARVDDPETLVHHGSTIQVGKRRFLRLTP